VSQGGLPDPACSPGAVDPRVTQANIVTTICARGYSTSVRPAETVTEQIKREQMAAYGVRGQRLGDSELDHLISLELGGASQEVANLWPEPWNGEANAHMKDPVENYLHDQVCRGALPLAEAQRAIATDWLAVYRRRGLQPAQ
jgi:5-methylcytosine-specific restriction endonuclease McrA